MATLAQLDGLLDTLVEAVLRELLQEQGIEKPAPTGTRKLARGTDEHEGIRECQAQSTGSD